MRMKSWLAGVNARQGHDRIDVRPRGWDLAQAPATVLASPISPSR